MSTQDQRRGGKKKGGQGRRNADDDVGTPTVSVSAVNSSPSSEGGAAVEEALRETANKLVQQTNQGRSITIPQKTPTEGTITPFNTPVNPNIVHAAGGAAGGAGKKGGGGAAGGGAGKKGGHAKNRNHDDEDEDEDQDDENLRVEDGLIRLTEDIKAKLGQLAIDDFLSKLPPNVVKRVHAVQGIQGELNELHQKFLSEIKELEKKYELLNAPHYERRKDLVSGKREPTDEELKRGEAEVEKDRQAAKGDDEEEEEEEAVAPMEDTDEKGIPGFWLRALQQHDLFEQNIQDRDEEALSALTDISYETFDRSETDKGFSLYFHFAPNPFFKNEVLTKTYYLVEEDELMLDRAEGTQIDWNEGQNLTVKTVRKRQKHRSGKNIRTVTKLVPCDSFFNFFSPPRAEELDSADAVHQANIEELLEADFELGQTLKETIIPRAVDFFTGKAMTFGDMDDEDFDEEDFNDEDDEDNDDDDDDDAPPARGAARRGARGGHRGAAPPAGGAIGEQPECKQQ